MYKTYEKVPLISQLCTNKSLIYRTKRFANSFYFVLCQGIPNGNFEEFVEK